jgi:hypothetical protein
MALSYIGNKNCKLLIIVDYISEVDYNEERLTDVGGISVLSHIIDKVIDGWDMNDVCITWVDKTPVAEFTKPKKIKNFDLVVFKEEVLAFSPKSILALGSRTASYLLGTTLSEARHTLHDFDGVPMIFSDSPRGLNDYKILLNDIVTAINLVENPDQDPYEERVIPYTEIKTFDELRNAIDQCRKTGYFCMDFETDGGDWFDDLVSLLYSVFLHNLVIHLY